MIGFHCTTPKKLERYIATGCILPPVRFWNKREYAVAWAKRTNRTILLKIEAKIVHPMPDHKPLGRAWFTFDPIYSWKQERENA